MLNRKRGTLLLVTCFAALCLTTVPAMAALYEMAQNNLVDHQVAIKAVKDLDVDPDKTDPFLT